MSSAFQLVLAVSSAAVVSLGCAAALALHPGPVLTRRLIGFGAGALVAAAAVDLAPDALRGGLAPGALVAAMLAGVAGFALLERTVLRGHSHADAGHGSGFRRAAPLVLLADAMHNVADGVVVAAAFLHSPATGWATAFAIAAHEIPHEAGAFALLRAAGWTVRATVLWNVVSALAALAAATLAYRYLSTVSRWLPALLGVVAGSFVYVAWVSIRPLLDRQSGAPRVAFSWAAIGAFAVAGLTVLLR